MRKQRSALMASSSLSKSGMLESSSGFEPAATRNQASFPQAQPSVSVPTREMHVRRHVLFSADLVLCKLRWLQPQLDRWKRPEHHGNVAARLSTHRLRSACCSEDRDMSAAAQAHSAAASKTQRVTHTNSFSGLPAHSQVQPCKPVLHKRSLQSVCLQGECT